MVGAVRFELTTSCTPSKRATKLRYAPSHCIDSSLPTAGFNHEDFAISLHPEMVPERELSQLAADSRAKNGSKNFQRWFAFVAAAAWDKPRS